MPAAIAVSNVSRRFELIDAAWAIPLGILLGLVSILLARRARRRVARSVLGARGGRTARVGRLLGIAGLLLAVTAAMAVGVYELLAAVDA